MQANQDNRTEPELLNVLSVDVEDYHNQLAVDFQNRIEPPDQEAERCTEKMLEIFSDCGVKGTFFILGEIAKAYPELVRRIGDEGHHLGVHGYHHLRLQQQSKVQFRGSISKAKWLIEDLVGREADAYRAPCFSLDASTLWALEVVADLGFRYDSSIFPTRSGYEGTPGQRSPYLYRLPNGKTIWEVPLSTVEIAGRRVGACGGGYLRMFPLRYTQYAVRQLHEAGDPVVIYLHPYELEPRPRISALPAMSVAQSLSFHFFNFHQCVGRSSVESKVRWLLDHHRFGTIQQLVASREQQHATAAAGGA
jgi:polysaccharide deacetylase family protein (PEP-CTERM system associated)